MKALHATYFVPERQWLEDFAGYREALDVTLNALEAERARALRITSALDGVGGSRGSPRSDKYLTGIARYDMIIPYLEAAVKRYADELGIRMRYVNAISKPTLRDAVWMQYIVVMPVSDIAAYFGIARQNLSLRVQQGLAEIHEMLERDKAQAEQEQEKEHEKTEA